MLYTKLKTVPISNRIIKEELKLSVLQQMHQKIRSFMTVIIFFNYEKMRQHLIVD